MFRRLITSCPCHPRELKLCYNLNLLSIILPFRGLLLVLWSQRNGSDATEAISLFDLNIEGVTLFNKVRSSEIRKSLNIEPLLFRIERSQLRWFGHVSRMPQERLPKQALLAKANGRRPVGRPRTRWTDYVEDLGWNRLGLRPSEMMEVMEDREVWRLNLELLPP